MWLAVSLLAALGASAAYWLFQPLREKYKLGFLALMLWGTALMVAADHFIAFLDGSSFISMSTNGLIENSALLGLAMVAPIFLVWLAALALEAGTGPRRAKA